MGSRGLLPTDIVSFGHSCGFWGITLFTTIERSGCLMYHWQGAHLETRDGIDGTRFAVWAPNAEEVSVLCDANGWTPGRDTLCGSDSGVWNGFVPGITHGATYKYGIRTRDGALL